MAKEGNFTPYQDYDQRELFHGATFDSVLDVGGSCGDGCDIGADYD